MQPSLNSMTSTSPWQRLYKLTVLKWCRLLGVFASHGEMLQFYALQLSFACWGTGFWDCMLLDARAVSELGVCWSC